MENKDIFKTEKHLKRIYKSLEDGSYLPIQENVAIIKKYVDYKCQGNYKHLIYNCNTPERTIYKNLIVLRKTFLILNKPVSEITEDDIVNLQSKLNRNEICCSVTKKPITYSYKYDIVKNFKQFWEFYRAYRKYEDNVKIENLAEYLRLRKNKNANILVKFLSKREVESLVNHSKNLKMRVLLKLLFETGARPIEILNLRMFNCSLDPKTNRWTIKLPQMKGISTEKMPIEIDYTHVDFCAFINTYNFKEEDLLFDYAYDYFRLYLADTSQKVLGRHITPKIFRKSCAMHLVNLDINEQYIKSHMGWSANSKAISHYISQKAIKKPDKLKQAQTEDSESEIEMLKNRLKQMEAMFLQRFADEF